MLLAALQSPCGRSKEIATEEPNSLDAVLGIISWLASPLTSTVGT